MLLVFNNQMDAKDIELDLLALQRLYGLLNGDGQSTATNDKVCLLAKFFPCDKLIIEDEI